MVLAGRDATIGIEGDPLKTDLYQRLFHVLDNLLLRAPASSPGTLAKPAQPVTGHFVGLLHFSLLEVIALSGISVNRRG